MPRMRPTLLITGANGTLGNAFARICLLRGLDARLTTRAELDIADETSVAAALDWHRPWAVINTAGYVRVDAAEQEFARCYRENTTGAHVLASACVRRGIGFVTFSSDLVFDGGKAAPYVEHDPAAPLNVYGQSKLQAETVVLQTHPAALIIRTSAFFGPWDRYNIVTSGLQALLQGVPFGVPIDVVVSPTYVPDLVHGTLDLLIDGEYGLWHLANSGATTWLALVERAATLAGIATGDLHHRPAGEFWRAVRLPAYSVLGSERGALLPPLDDALQRYVCERDPALV